MVTAPDKILLPVPVDVEHGSVNRPYSCVEHYRFPSGTDIKNRSLPIGRDVAGDYIQLPVSREIGGDCGLVGEAFGDHVPDPLRTFLIMNIARQTQEPGCQQKAPCTHGRPSISRSISGAMSG